MHCMFKFVMGGLTNTFLPDFVKKANIVWKIFSFS